MPGPAQIVVEPLVVVVVFLTVPADTQVAGAKADELSAGCVEEEEVCLAGLTDGSKLGKKYYGIWI